MTFLKKHWQLAVPVAMIAFLIFFGWRVISQHARVIDLGLFILLGVGILLIPVTDLAGQILSKLKEQATAVTNETTMAVASVSSPSPRTHRQELELAMVGRMGDLPLYDPALEGKHVKTMLDSLLAKDGPPMPSPDEQVAERALRQVLSVVQSYLPPDGISIDDAMSKIIALVDPFPIGSNAAELQAAPVDGIVKSRADLHKCLIHGVAACPCHKESNYLLRSAGYPADLLGTSPQPGASTIALQVVDPGPDALEREIQAKGLTAPRVTKEDIEAEITHEHYFTAEQGARHPDAHNPRDHGDVQPCLAHLTFCVLVLKNGFRVTGESACVSSENFDAQIGRDYARANAIEKMWLLLGFRLADKVHSDLDTPAERG